MKAIVEQLSAFTWAVQCLNLSAEPWHPVCATASLRRRRVIVWNICDVAAIPAAQTRALVCIAAEDLGHHCDNL